MDVDILITRNEQDAVAGHDEKHKKLFECCRVKQIKLKFNSDKNELSELSLFMR